MYNYLLDVCLNEEFFINFLISLFIYKICVGYFDIFFNNVKKKYKKKYVDESFYLN